MQVINDYGIASKVGYFVMDNADNNDTMMVSLSKSLYKLSSIQTWANLYFTVLFDQYKINYNPLYHRLRCNGHIINLAAQAFLFHTEDEALAEDNNTKLLSLPTEAEMARWRK